MNKFPHHSHDPLRPPPVALLTTDEPEYPDTLVDDIVIGAGILCAGLAVLIAC